MESFITSIIREKILTALETPPPVLTPREASVPRIPDKAMVVIGMRRAGKTSFLHQQRATLIEKGRNPARLLYFNFEDERLAGMEARHLRLIPETHLSLFPEPTPEPLTLFLDEIQTVSGWETFVRRLLDERKYEIFLSGSSAKLLSREIATSMRGRGWEIIIHPFSFNEWLHHHGYNTDERPSLLSPRKSAQIDKYFANYLKTGGFPEAQRLDAQQRRLLLQSYVDVLMLRDILERHHVNHVTALRWMVRRLLGNPGSLFSVTKFEADLKSQGIAAGRETLYNLLDHMQDAFLLQAIPIASESEKRRQVNPRKVYPNDHALAQVFDRSLRANTGHALEVAVYNEMLRRRCDITYVKTPGGYEVDFLCRDSIGSESLIQVCATLEDPHTLAREIRALQEAAKLYPRSKLLILTAASTLPLTDIPKPIQVVPAWQWMLQPLT